MLTPEIRWRAAEMRQSLNRTNVYRVMPAHGCHSRALLGYALECLMRYDERHINGSAISFE